MEHIAKPKWLKTPLPSGRVYFEIKKDLRERKLFTVCEEAKCPNIGTCWNQRTATFMVLGDICTRACRFCHIKTGHPGGLLDPKEAQNVAESCQLMKLKYVVLTMVDRDDLVDGGAAHLQQVIEAVKEKNPGIIIELLCGDLAGNKKNLAKVLATNLQVFAHNIETVKRLSPRVRDRRAAYQQSLDMLKEAKNIAGNDLISKSALMLGLGETYDEVIEALVDLRAHGVEFVTIGQYMRPSKKHLSVKEWVHPEVFTKISQKATELGFRAVASSPLVRSSYRAWELYQKAHGKSFSLASIQSGQDGEKLR